MDVLAQLVRRARAGDLEAYGRVVQATQTMARAVASVILRDASLAEDAAQEAYLRAFRRLDDLDEPGAFTPWLRRIVITVALNMRRSRRRTLLRLDDIPAIPVLDEQETSWSELQRQRLARALLTLSGEERRLCDRRYHGQWSTARLAREAGIDEAAMRKRLQRIRDKLRKEIEVSEREALGPDQMRTELPAKVVELLARPQLSVLPDNPVGKVLDQLRAVYAEFAEVSVPEIVDFADARTTIGDEALYLDPLELHRVDDRRILRYDLTLPLLLSARYERAPLRLWTAGKTYRVGTIDAMHLEAFHQAEVLWVDDRSTLDRWAITKYVLQSADTLFPGRSMKIVPTRYPMCREAWELEVEDGGQWFEVLAWGLYTDKIVRHLGADPERHAAAGVGHGLERLAMVRFGIDDIRKIETSRVA